MNETIKDFLANIRSLHELRVENLPEEVLAQMAKMDAQELYKTCTQFVVLEHNIPNEQKVLNLDQDELLSLVKKYGEELLKRITR
jgi:hypothetical protein